MPTYTDTVDDLCRKYRKTYILYDKKIQYINEFEPSSMDSKVIMCHNGKIWAEFNPDLAEVPRISYGMKNLSCAFNRSNQFIGHAIHVSKNPKRHGILGICSETLSCRSPMMQAFQLLKSDIVVPDLRVGNVEELMSETYPGIDLAFEMCKTWVSVAISPLFWVSLSPFSENNHLIGTPFGVFACGNALGITIYHSTPFQEFQDYMTRSNVKIPVRIASCPI